MSHSADADSYHADKNMIELPNGDMIEILSAQGCVRQRTEMFIISTDYRGLHALIQLTVEGLLWHYHFLKIAPPNQMSVRLEEDGSAIVTSTGGTMLADVLEKSIQWLERELSMLMTGYPNSLFIVNALSRSLNVTRRVAENHWRSLLFKQGMLQREEACANPPGEDCDIQFCIQPDFTVLEPGAFDYQYVLELIRLISESDPIVPITVLDVRSHTA